MALIRWRIISAPRLRGGGGAENSSPSYFWDILYSDLFRYAIDLVSAEVFLGHVTTLNCVNYRVEWDERMITKGDLLKGFEGDVRDLFKGN
jgi:hypothetical protein